MVANKFQSGQLSVLLSVCHHEVLAIPCHCVNSASHRSIFANSFAHGLQIISPANTKQSSIVHQQLAIYSMNVKQANIALLQRLDFFVAELILAEQFIEAALKALANMWVTVQLIDKLLDKVKAHVGMFAVKVADQFLVLGTARQGMILKRDWHMLPE